MLVLGLWGPGPLTSRAPCAYTAQDEAVNAVCPRALAWSDALAGRLSEGAPGVVLEAQRLVLRGDIRSPAGLSGQTLWRW